MKVVLLPGPDGTRRLFAPLLSALPPGLEPIVAEYASDDLVTEVSRAVLRTAMPDPADNPKQQHCVPWCESLGRMESCCDRRPAP